MTGRTCKVGRGHGSRRRCLDVEKFEFYLGVRGRLRASFWEAFGDPGVTLSGFLGTRKTLEFGRTPWGPNLDFSRFLMDFGSPEGPTLASF